MIKLIIDAARDEIFLMIIDKVIIIVLRMKIPKIIMKN